MEQVNDKELLNKHYPDDGFAAYYCKKCEDEQMDVQIFKKLVELDAKLGITAVEQLHSCLKYTTKLYIIQV